MNINAAQANLVIRSYNVPIRTWAQRRKKACTFDVEHSDRSNVQSNFQTISIELSDWSENSTVHNPTFMTYSIIKITLKLFLTNIFQL